MWASTIREDKKVLGVSGPGTLIVDADEKLHMRKDNLTGTGAPGVLDDSSEGYEVGSGWYDTVGLTWYRCTDASVGAAAWVELGASTSPGGSANDIQINDGAGGFSGGGPTWNGSLFSVNGNSETLGVHYVSDSLRHHGDSDTGVFFTPDVITMQAGAGAGLIVTAPASGQSVKVVSNNAADITQILEGAIVQTADYININSYGNTGGDVLAVDASKKVTLGTGGSIDIDGLTLTKYGTKWQAWSWVGDGATIFEVAGYNRLPFLQINQVYRDGSGALGDVVIGTTTQQPLGANRDFDTLLVKRDVDGASAYSEAGALLHLHRDVTNVTSEDGNFLECSTDGSTPIFTVDASGNLTGSGTLGTSSNKWGDVYAGDSASYYVMIEDGQYLAKLVSGNAMRAQLGIASSRGYFVLKGNGTGTRAQLWADGDGYTMDNFGVGTSSPAHKLSVGDGTADTRVFIKGSSNFQLGIAGDGSSQNTWLGTDASGNLKFWNNAGTVNGFAINQSGSVQLADGSDVLVGNSAGTQIGTNSTDKIAFLGATPASQQSHIADPTGGATQDTEARAAIASALAVLETFGFTALT